MGAITYDRIRLESEIEITELGELTISMQGNHHARAFLTGRISEGTMARRHEIMDSLIKINYLGEGAGPPVCLFAGLVQQVFYKNIQEENWVEIELASATIMLDKERKSRSFQKSGLSHQDIVGMVLGNQNKVQHISTAGGQTIDKPIIQYHETDWEFLKRLASHSQAAVYPDVKTDYARVWFGFPDEIQQMEVGEADYAVGICPEYLDSEIPARWYTYFDIELHLDYDIGTGVSFQQGKWRIEQKHAELKQGMLVFKYRLRKEESLLTEKKYQPMFVGMSILGTVLEADGENVKLHLDIDPSQDAGEAYAYQWTPDTGSAMYCMPKVGTKAALYFPDRDEQTARATSCVRENGGSCPAMSDPSKRGLSTEYGKELFLNPEEMGLKSETSQFGLIDGQGIAMETMKKASVTSEKKITLSGKKVSLETPKEMQMARG